MNIYIARHGQTRLNKLKFMQGLTDEPLNETGINQAKEKNEKLKDIKFDAIYSSPLVRAVKTAELISGKSNEEIIKDKRIIEVDFGKYECKKYYLLGPLMTLYWMFPEVFIKPKSVESTSSMISRSVSFLSDVEKKDYQNVLIVCHGGIIRTLRGYLEDKKNGLKWRPKPKNTEIYVYESTNGKHKFLRTI